MKQYIVDAFSDKLFSGNQAAVCILEKQLPDELMQNIAKENNFSETAFAVKAEDGYRLRWFTPGGEIDSCGHATLGTAYVIKRFYAPSVKSILFHTKCGDIPVIVKDDMFEMDFPAYTPKEIPISPDMEEAIGVKPAAAYIDRDLMLVVNSEADVRSLRINTEAMKRLDGLCTAVTAKSDHGKPYDCVSRVFAPKLNVTEDPVTGSTHCMIIPYWSKILNKKNITAFQASERTGILYSEFENGRVKIAGRAVLFSVSDILTDNDL
ncbi:MAG: PhzF family phenazine biosynthesis protein [Huintestinicola sp.]